MNYMKRKAKALALIASAASMGVVLTMQQAMAAVDVTAITGAATDVGTVIAAIFGIAVLIVGGKLVRRAL